MKLKIMLRSILMLLLCLVGIAATASVLDAGVITKDGLQSISIMDFEFGSDVARAAEVRVLDLQTDFVVLYDVGSPIPESHAILDISLVSDLAGRSPPRMVFYAGPNGQLVSQINTDTHPKKLIFSDASDKSKNEKEVLTDFLYLGLMAYKPPS